MSECRKRIDQACDLQLFAASKRPAGQKDNTAASFDKDNRDSMRPSLAESTTTLATLVQEPDTEPAAYATGPAGRQLTQRASQSEELATELVKCIYDIATDNEEVASSQAKMLWQTHIFESSPNPPIILYNLAEFHLLQTLIFNLAYLRNRLP
ncbi:MAG: hypothetical protein LQ344_005474 [Seirophora lacunosa]|nr:MAG: hypothetical protein LQ344_005474 [Seirophora lacunosa]